MTDRISQLHDDILALAGELTLQAALRSLRIAHAHEAYDGISIVTDWYRSGAETHLIVFEVTFPARSHRLVMKACTPTAVARPIDEIVARWLARRALLEHKNVRAPHLYGVAAATLLEDYIPYSLAALPNGVWTQQLTEEVLNFADALSELKFHAIEPFSDLRSDGVHVYAVDFGADLGEPGAVTHCPTYRAQAIEWIERVRRASAPTGSAANAPEPE